MIQWGWRCSHADHVCYLDDDWRCHAWTGPGNMTNDESFANKTLLSANLYLFWSCSFGYGGYTFLGYDYPELYGANAQNTYRRIHKSYCSRLIHTKRCCWAVFLERIESRALEALYALKAMKALCASYAMYAKYANVLVEKRTLVEKSKIWNLKSETKLHILYAIYWTTLLPWDWRTKF